MPDGLDFHEPNVAVPRRRAMLTHADAIEIWIARWLRTPQKQLVARYQCDPRRLYEVWQEDKFIGSRDKALLELNKRFPFARDRIDPGTHRPVARTAHPDQLVLI
jgi:hypothetical protein